MHVYQPAKNVHNTAQSKTITFPIYYFLHKGAATFERKRLPVAWCTVWLVFNGESHMGGQQGEGLCFTRPWPNCAPIAFAFKATGANWPASTSQLGHLLVLILPPLFTARAHLSTCKAQKKTAIEEAVSINPNKRGGGRLFSFSFDAAEGGGGWILILEDKEKKTPANPRRTEIETLHLQGAQWWD